MEVLDAVYYEYGQSPKQKEIYLYGNSVRRPRINVNTASNANTTSTASTTSDADWNTQRHFKLRIACAGSILLLGRETLQSPLRVRVPS